MHEEPACKQRHSRINGKEKDIVIWAFIAGMLCGALILILLILVNDRSFLDLLAGRFASQTASGPGARESRDLQKSRSLAVGSDS